MRANPSPTTTLKGEIEMMNKPIKPTYTRLERFAIWFTGTCKRKAAYEKALQDWSHAEAMEEKAYREEMQARREYYRTHPEKPRASIYDRKPFEYARTIGIKGVFEHI